MKFFEAKPEFDRWANFRKSAVNETGVRVLLEEAGLWWEHWSTGNAAGGADVLPPALSIVHLSSVHLVRSGHASMRTRVLYTRPAWKISLESFLLSFFFR